MAAGRQSYLATWALLICSPEALSPFSMRIYFQPVTYFLQVPRSLFILLYLFYRGNKYI